jgi:hypothetical protein
MTATSTTKLRESLARLILIMDYYQDEITVLNLIPYAESDGAKAALWQLKKTLSHHRRSLK